MTTRHEERSVPADALAPLPFAAAFAHLRGASSAVDRLLVDVSPSEPNHYVLLMVSQAIHEADQALMDCVRGPGQ
jgi:hypothetical protein